MSTQTKVCIHFLFVFQSAHIALDTFFCLTTAHEPDHPAATHYSQLDHRKGTLSRTAEERANIYLCHKVPTPTQSSYYVDNQDTSLHKPSPVVDVFLPVFSTLKPISAQSSSWCYSSSTGETGNGD